MGLWLIATKVEPKRGDAQQVGDDDAEIERVDMHRGAVRIVARWRCVKMRWKRMVENDTCGLGLSPMALLFLPASDLAALVTQWSTSYVYGKYHFP